jgi:putative DNA methylase
MPLVRSFALSTKPGKKAWIEPLVNNGSRTVSFKVVTGEGDAPAGTVDRNGARCLICGVTVPLEHIRTEGKARRLGSQMIGIVAEGQRERVYSGPLAEHIEAASLAAPDGMPETEMPAQALGFRVQGYGMTRHRDLFTNRQLIALSTLGHLIEEARNKIVADGGSPDYAAAVSIYLAFAVDKTSESSTQLCTWSALPTKLHVVSTFGRQVLAMVWDFAESNPFAESAGNFGRMTELVSSVLEQGIASFARVPGHAEQMDAAASSSLCGVVVSSDPPYYDNISYADLSDFFYVWLRRNVGALYPSLFGTLVVPRLQELIATPFRFEGSMEKAKKFFESGLEKAFGGIRKIQDPEYPSTIYYAFKQSESEDDEGGEVAGAVASTGWETMLEALIRAGLQICGTWPMRTERAGGFRNKGRNSLASSIILVCRPRPESASVTTRKDFIGFLKKDLPRALRNMQEGQHCPCGSCAGGYRPRNGSILSLQDGA